MNTVLFRFGFVLGLALTSGTASAQNAPLARGIDPVTNKLSPSIGSNLTLSGTDTAPATSFQLDLWVDYNKGLLAFQLGDEKLGDLVQHRLDLHLMGAYALTDRIELAADLPLTLWQDDGFDELARQTGFNDQPTSAPALGDVRLQVRGALLSRQELPVGLALVLEGRGYTGAGDSFLGERQLMLYPRAVLEPALGDRLSLQAELGYRYRTEPGQYLNIYVGDEYSGGVGGAYRIVDEPAVRHSVLAEVLASTQARAPFTFDTAAALKTPIEVLAGWRGEFLPHVHVTAGLGRGFAITPGFGREELRIFASLRYVDHAAGRPVEDRDGDGVLDRDDECPDEPGRAELEGCNDSDRDGIYDVQDKCPTDRGVAKLDGCPTDKPLVVYEDGELIVFGQITFDTNQDTIKDESFPVLDKAAEVLIAHEELAKIRVDGHTDDHGASAHNHSLSARRAASVVRYLTEKGVAAARLESKGFGEENPIATNATALGRAKNRRVEFTVVEAAHP